MERLKKNIFPKTELQKLTDLELEYKRLIYFDLLSIKNNFNFDSNIRFISLMLLKAFGILFFDSESTENMNEKLRAVFGALKAPGTYESTKTLLSSFLGISKFRISNNKAGAIDIKLLSPPKMQSPTVIKRLLNHNIIKVKYKGKIVAIAIASIPISYTQNVFGYIKSLIPVGRDIKIHPYKVGRKE